MENVFQLMLTVASVVVAIALVVALGHLSAIRKSLETLVAQRRMPAQQTRDEVASDQAQPAEEAPAQGPPPIYRPVIVTPPPPPPPPPTPIQQTRFEAAREEVMPAGAPAIVSPPPPPVPVQKTRFEAASEQAPPAEEIPDQGLSAEVSSEWARPAESPETANLEPPTPAAPRASRLPVVIGILVLLGAIGFLAFLVLYTK